MTQLTTPLRIAEYHGDFVQMLLDQQQQMTAVQRFSAHHAETFDVPAQGRYYRDLLPATPPAEGQQYAFEVDLDACSGCKSCVVACHALNGLDEDETWRQVGTLSGGSESDGALFHVTAACHHCVEPGCLEGCPVLAYDKDPVTGIVRHLDDQCIGCKYCTMMCPYEVPRYSEQKGIVRKCDMCRQRLAVGEAPACVAACPNEAIRIATVDVADVRQKSTTPREALVPEAPASALTLPTTTYRTNNPGLHFAVPQDRSAHTPNESHWPLAAMLVLTQASMGILATGLVASLLARMDRAPFASTFTRDSLTMALVLALVGLGIAPLHLGRPLKAWRVFLGLRTSWLSREAVLLGKYAGLLAAAASLAWLPAYRNSLPAEWLSYVPSRFLPALQITALGVGSAGAYSSAMIYIATRRTMWRFSRTIVRFALSAVSSGCFLVLPLLASATSGRLVLMLFFLGALASLGSKAAYEWWLHLGGSRKSDSESAGESESQRLDRQSRQLVRQFLLPLARLRFAAAATGGGIATAAMVLILLNIQSAAVALFAVAAISVLAGELYERLLYFSSVVHPRMPRTLA